MKLFVSTTEAPDCDCDPLGQFNVEPCDTFMQTAFEAIEPEASITEQDKLDALHKANNNLARLLEFAIRYVYANSEHDLVKEKLAELGFTEGLPGIRKEDL